MSLFAATFVAGFILVLLGLPLLIDHSGAKAAIQAFPRSASAGYVVFGAGAACALRLAPGSVAAVGRTVSVRTRVCASSPAVATPPRMACIKGRGRRRSVAASSPPTA